MVNTSAIFRRFLHTLLSDHLWKVLNFRLCSHIQRHIRESEFHLILFGTFGSGRSFIVTCVIIILRNIGVSASVVCLCFLSCSLLCYLFKEDVFIIKET